MATLEQFLKTGQLGPLSFGMSPFDVTAVLGDPVDQSRKKNPLVLRYGSLQLTFLKDAVQPKPKLKEIVIAYHGSGPSLPEPVRPSDWQIADTPTEAEFRAFLERIEYVPAHAVQGQVESHLTLSSGAKVTFSYGRLYDIRFAQRAAAEKVFIPLTDEREPSDEQIADMLREATLSLSVNAHRAGLVIAWAALEATLRRLALRAGVPARIGVQPIILIRELQATRIITPEEFSFINAARQLRTEIAHGVATRRVDSDLVRDLIALTTRMLHQQSGHDS